MSGTVGEIRRPSIWLQMLETRAVPELGAFAWLYPLLHLAPRGDGHPVLVLPGFLPRINQMMLQAMQLSQSMVTP